MRKMAACLWFDDRAEEAAKYYTSIFPNSKITRVLRYDAASAEASGRPEGSVLTVDFELDGDRFVGLNGGPEFQFSPAISFIVECETQEEIDRYWEKLTAGGDEKAQQCGWLADKFGMSWQVVPRKLDDMLADEDRERAERVMKAMLAMKKMDIAALERAYEEQPTGVS
jgi:predicted 3-demethylubiquinone-9 3-methyltransferase (glyoxalase superfamily)